MKELNVLIVGQNTVAQFPSVPNFFVFSEQNLYRIFTSIFYLVKWGFSRNEIKDMPIEEFEEYEKMLIEYYKKQNEHTSEVKNSVSAPSSSSSKEPVTNPYGKIG